MPRTPDETRKPEAAPASKPSKPRARKSPSVSSNGNGEVRLTADRLVVRPPDGGERKSAGGLLIPATAMAAPKRLVWADVHLVGPDVRVATPGDRVLFLPSSGLEVDFDGEELVLLRERDVQAVTSPATDKKDRAPGQYL
jgi:chaperonin GroES